MARESQYGTPVDLKLYQHWLLLRLPVERGSWFN